MLLLKSEEDEEKEEEEEEEVEEEKEEEEEEDSLKNIHPFMLLSMGNHGCNDRQEVQLHHLRGI